MGASFLYVEYPAKIIRKSLFVGRERAPPLPPSGVNPLGFTLTPSRRLTALGLMERLKATPWNQHRKDRPDSVRGQPEKGHVIHVMMPEGRKVKGRKAGQQSSSKFQVPSSRLGREGLSTTSHQLQTAGTPVGKEAVPNSKLPAKKKNNIPNFRCLNHLLFTIYHKPVLSKGRAGPTTICQLLATGCHLRATSCELRAAFGAHPPSIVEPQP